jgi:pimeloyl-ACP methyl ester carboxylesterase
LFALTATYLLSQKPDNNLITSDSGYVNVNDGKLFYEVAGKGENIVLLHDGMVNHRIWDEQFPVLAKNYRVVRYDRRGYGKSSDPQAKYSHFDDLNQVFIQLKVEKAVIFGMSYDTELLPPFMVVRLPVIIKIRPFVY